MAKKAATRIGLLEQIKSLPPPGKQTRPAWHDTMQSHSPELYKDLIELVQDFNANGPSRKVFPSVACLFQYLSGNDPLRPGPNLLGDIKCGTFRVFVANMKAR